MNQVEFFNSIAETWDSRTRVDEERINKLLSQISIRNGESILDVGTGTGVLIPFYKHLNSDGELTGVDISSGMINMAERKFGQLINVNFKLLDVEKDTIYKKYDKIVLYSMFPHLNNKTNTIKKLVRENLKVNGKLLIAHSDSREFLNNLHSNVDKSVSEDRLIEVNKQKKIFESINLNVTKAYEDDKIYYIVIENI